MSGVSKNVVGMIRHLINDGVLLISNDGAPTDGTSGTGNGLAGPGSFLIDFTNTDLYRNTNTLASPTWTLITIASVGDHLLVRTLDDSRTVRINSRNYVQTSGSSIGMQSKPSQTVTTTGDIIGAEFSPRANDVDTGAIIAIKADPVVKDATSARTVSALRGLEINIDLPNAGSAVTFTNEVCGIRMFPDFGAGHTFSANRPAILLATPNTSDWTHFLQVESAGTMAVVTAGTFTTADGHLLIDIAGTDYLMPFYLAAD